MLEHKVLNLEVENEITQLGYIDYYNSSALNLCKRCNAFYILRSYKAHVSVGTLILVAENTKRQ